MRHTEASMRYIIGNSDNFGTEKKSTLEDTARVNRHFLFARKIKRVQHIHPRYDFVI